MAESSRTKRLWWLVGLLIAVIGWGGRDLVGYVRSTAQANTMDIAAIKAQKLDRGEFLQYQEKVDRYMEELRSNDAAILKSLTDHELASQRRFGR